MVSEILVKIFRKKGLNDQQIIAKAKELGEELPQGFYDNLKPKSIYDIPRDQRKERKIGSLKGGGVVRAFRPSAEVDLILTQESGKGKVSQFINNAIKYYYKNYYLKD